MKESAEVRILEAAEAEFLSKGYAGARTTSIAEAAGVTHALLHYYFRTKEKLFAHVVGEKLSAIVHTFTVMIDEEKSLDECVRGAVMSHFDFVRSNPLLPRFMVNEVFSSPSLMNLLREKFATNAGNAIAVLQRKLDKEMSKPVSAISLIMDIVSLNIFPILAMPMIENVLNINPDEILDARREANVNTILCKLRNC